MGSPSVFVLLVHLERLWGEDFLKIPFTSGPFCDRINVRHNLIRMNPTQSVHFYLGKNVCSLFVYFS